MTSPYEIVLDASQEEAVRAICTAGICVITGGPGTGKTTCLRNALEALDVQARASGRRTPVVLLVAPTGKAARRMRDATERQTSTIHRAIGWMGGDWRESHGLDMSPDLIVVDEASMVDTELMAALLHKTDPRYIRLVLVGDVNQLPSVGPGCVLHDLIQAGVPTVTLQTLHRSAAQSWMYTNAPKILDGEKVDLSTKHDFQFVEVEDVDKVALVLTELFELELNRISEVLGYEMGLEEALEHVQILSPQRVGPIGADVLNRHLQEQIHGSPAGGFEIDEETVVGDGDKVIQIRNDYQLDVMNGETGNVRGIKERKLIVEIDERDVAFDKSAARNLRLGYVISIHRSQGSEYPTCIVLCHSSHRRMLSRRLLYTAVTRAKKRLVLVGDRRGVEMAVANIRDADRQTYLQERVLGSLGGD